MAETKPRRFRTHEGAAKALAQELGVQGYPGGYLGLPPDLTADEVRAITERLGVRFAEIRGAEGELQCWRLTMHTGAPYRGWPGLAVAMARRGGLVEADLGSKGWKWVDRS